MRRVLSVMEFIKESTEEKEQLFGNPGKSKILDKNGKLLPVYKAVDLTNESNIIDNSFVFSTSKKAALGFGKDINEYVLYLENPLYMLNYGKDATTPEEWLTWVDVKEKYFDNNNDPYKSMTEDGYDCLIELNDKALFHNTAFDEILNPNTIIVFDTSKIKKVGGRRWYEV